MKCGGCVAGAASIFFDELMRAKESQAAAIKLIRYVLNNCLEIVEKFLSHKGDMAIFQGLEKHFQELISEEQMLDLEVC